MLTVRCVHILSIFFQSQFTFNIILYLLGVYIFSVLNLQCLCKMVFLFAMPKPLENHYFLLSPPKHLHRPLSRDQREYNLLECDRRWATITLTPAFHYPQHHELKIRKNWYWGWNGEWRRSQEIQEEKQPKLSQHLPTPQRIGLAQ